MHLHSLNPHGNVRQAETSSSYFLPSFFLPQDFVVCVHITHLILPVCWPRVTVKRETRKRSRSLVKVHHDDLILRKCFSERERRTITMKLDPVSSAIPFLWQRQPSGNKVHVVVVCAKKAELFSCPDYSSTAFLCLWLESISFPQYIQGYRGHRVGPK